MITYCILLANFLYETQMIFVRITSKGTFYPMKYCGTKILPTLNFSTKKVFCRMERDTYEHNSINSDFNYREYEKGDFYLKVRLFKILLYTGILHYEEGHL